MKNNVLDSSTLHEKWPDLRLHVERLDTSMVPPFYFFLKNVTNMVSCKTSLGADTNQRFHKGLTVKKSLLSNLRLETVHLINDEKEVGDVDWDWWDEGDARKLPPVKELVIRGFLGWKIFGICDWSHITYLELTNVSNLALIECLPPEGCSRLQTFIIACECWDLDELQRLTVFLNVLLSFTSDLEQLNLKCGAGDFLQIRPGCCVTSKSTDTRKPNDCVSAITQSCQRLRSLHFRNFECGPFSVAWSWAQLSPHDLQAIRCSCPSLMELSLDAKLYLYGCQPRLDIDVTAGLARFRNLRRLTVYTMMPYSPPEAGLRPHHQARAVAREWIENMLRLKQGVKFETLTMNIEIERLGEDDEFQRIDYDDDWWVCLKYKYETAKGVSWCVTGEQRSLEFLRR